MPITTLILGSLLLPQGGDASVGPMVGAPHTVSVAAGTTGGGSLDASEIWFKEPGVGAAPPATMPLTAGVPDFRIASIMKGVSPRPDPDAMSIGVDWILADSNGYAVVPSGGWGFISFSVTPATVGEPGSLVQAEAQGDGAAADIFNWFVPNSPVPSGWSQEPIRAQNAAEIALGGSPADVDAHDIFTALYLLDPMIAALLPAQPTFYFSVSTATLGRVPSAWWGGTTPSGATILQCTWDATARSWSTPRVFLEAGDLGLALSEDIDALAVDPLRVAMLFSTTTASRDPILVALPKPGGGIKVLDYRLNDGPKTRVSTRLGIRGKGDVDAICSYDPGRGPGQQVLAAVLGRTVPRRLLPLAPEHGSISAFRRRLPAPGGDAIETWLNGWPRPGRPAPSLAILGLSFPGRPSAPLVIVQGLVRNPNPTGYPGGPLGLRLPVPRQHTLSGLDIQFNWITGEQQQPDRYTLPFPVVLRL